MNAKELGYLVATVLIFVLIFGYFKNIYKLTQCDFEPPYKCEVVHGLGIIPLVGIVTGWVDVGK